jgi:hypothetical protein
MRHTIRFYDSQIFKSSNRAEQRFCELLPDVEVCPVGWTDGAPKLRCRGSSFRAGELDGCNWYRQAEGALMALDESLKALAEDVKDARWRMPLRLSWSAGHKTCEVQCWFHRDRLTEKQARKSAERRADPLMSSRFGPVKVEQTEAGVVLSTPAYETAGPLGGKFIDFLDSVVVAFDRHLEREQVEGGDLVVVE